jgi:hypothetical protein
MNSTKFVAKLVTPLRAGPIPMGLGPPARGALATHPQLFVYAAANRRCCDATRKESFFSFFSLQRARARGVRASGRGQAKSRSP